MSEIDSLTLYVDGAAKGNPGPAGIGIQVVHDGEVLKEDCGYLGVATNNAAEYQALIRGLQLARDFEANSVQVISDSELVVNHMNGRYKVKSASLRPLFEEAQKLSREFHRFKISHVDRSQNKDADRLANEGIRNHAASGPDGRARKSEESPSSTGQNAG